MKHQNPERRGLPFLFVILAFFSIELFSFFFLAATEQMTSEDWWPLIFGGLCAVILGGTVRLLP
jgi:hypothetical protein